MKTSELCTPCFRCCENNQTPCCSEFILTGNHNDTGFTQLVRRECDDSGRLLDTLPESPCARN